MSLVPTELEKQINYAVKPLTDRIDERDRLRELLDIFKDACDPGKLDHQKLKVLEVGNE
jgi:hypothetical protein